MIFSRSSQYWIIQFRHVSHRIFSWLLLSCCGYFSFCSQFLLILHSRLATVPGYFRFSRQPIRELDREQARKERREAKERARHEARRERLYQEQVLTTGCDDRDEDEHDVPEEPVVVKVPHPTRERSKTKVSFIAPSNAPKDF